LSRGFHELDEPFVTGGSFDDHAILPEFLKPGGHRRRVAAGKPLPHQHLPLAAYYYHHAQSDSLLVEVGADVLHGIAPVVETELCDNNSRLPRFPALFQRGPTSVFS